MASVRSRGAVLALAVLIPLASVGAQQDTANADRPRDPVRDSVRRIERARAANNRALFRTTEPLRFTLIANYGAISRDRDSLSTRRFAGTVIVADTSGAERRIPVQLRTRGHFRLRASNCRFAPMRIDFPDSGRAGTPFGGQDALKLGSHCQGDKRYDDYLRREYLANRLYSVLTDYGLRARMAQGLYVDSASGRTVDDRPAIFFENEDEMARRMGGRIQEWRGAVFDDVEQRELLLMSMFQYAIGNTDWSLYALHNVRLLALPQGTIIPMAYDFDFSGLVNTHYATPDPRMGIRTVRNRLYRGPCRPNEEVQAVARYIHEKKDAMLAEIAGVPGFSQREQDAARAYLDDFFREIADPNAVKRTFVDNCDPKPGV